MTAVKGASFPTTIKSIDALRITIGRKVIKANCNLKFHLGGGESYIAFFFNEPQDEEVDDDLTLSELHAREHRVYLKQCDEMKEMKIFYNVNTSGGGCSTSVIAFRITPTARNGFDRFSEFYEVDDDEANDKGGRYITVEVNNTADSLVRL